MAKEILALIGNVQDEVAAHLGGDDAALTDRTRQLHADRLARLAATRDRLAGELGDDHPRVVELTDRHAFAARVGSDLDDLADRLRDPTTVGPQQWRLHGRVVDGSRRPVAGVSVHVVTHDDARDEIGKPAVTDKRGEYSAIFDSKAFAPRGSVRPVTVTVRDRTGNDLLTADEPIAAEGGETDYVEIVLRSAGKVRDAAETRRRCEAKTMKGTRCRNLARPDSHFCGVHAGG